jgi:hypothetical protein
MAFVENYESGHLVPFFALCLFAGIRPCVRNGEILKLKPADINLDTGVVAPCAAIVLTTVPSETAMPVTLCVWSEYAHSALQRKSVKNCVLG